MATELERSPVGDGVVREAQDGEGRTDCARVALGPDDGTGGDTLALGEGVCRQEAGTWLGGVGLQSAAVPAGARPRDGNVSDLVGAHVAALGYLRGGGESTLMNCGYGHGYSVRDVVDTVKRVSGVDFAVKMQPRRAGDPIAIVADAQAIRHTLSWSPAYDDLDIIVRHALSWEQKLIVRRHYTLCR